MQRSRTLGGTAGYLPETLLVFDVSKDKENVAQSAGCTAARWVFIWFKGSLPHSRPGLPQPAFHLDGSGSLQLVAASWAAGPEAEVF